MKRQATNWERIFVKMTKYFTENIYKEHGQINRKYNRKMDTNQMNRYVTEETDKHEDI